MIPTSAMPPSTATIPPSRPVALPTGTTGTPALLHSRQMAETFHICQLKLPCLHLVHLLPGLWPDHSLWRFPCVRPGILAVLGANIEPGCNPVNPEDAAEVGQEAGSQLCCGF